MNFFGIGLPEMIVVSVVAVIVLGPERFPQAAVQVARAIKFLRGYATENTKDLRAEFADLTKEYEAIREELQEVRKVVGSSVASATQAMTKVIDETKPALEAARPDRIFGKSEPIIEPGGDPPPDVPHSNNGA
jgi:Tat protein translocase TatB subunit